MPRFNLDRDIKFFNSIARELVDVVIETPVLIYKLLLQESRTNIYGESLNKVYATAVECSALIERDATSSNYDMSGPDTEQSVEFRFNRFTLKEREIYPEIGDYIYHNSAYFEITNVQEDQLIGGQVTERFSIICSTFMTRTTSLQIQPRL